MVDRNTPGAVRRFSAGDLLRQPEPWQPPTQPSRFAADLALRLKPLLDCIHRDLVNALPVRSQVQTLTERSAELEWLFKVTSSIKSSSNDQKLLDGILAAASERIDAARNQARGLLSKADPFTEAVVAKGDRKLFRARFAGLDRDQAEAVCRTLKRSEISCITVKN